MSPGGGNSERKKISWHELRMTVPTHATVIEPPAVNEAVKSLRVHGAEASSAVSYWVMVARQTLHTGTSLQEWSDSIIDLAAERRIRIRRQLGTVEVVMAVPIDAPIGTFVFAVVNGHGYNIMTGAAEDPSSQQEIAHILAALEFVSDPTPPYPPSV